MLLRLFQGQILLQFKFMILAAQQINDGLKQQDINGTFYGIQNLLDAAANAAKALWGSGPNFPPERKYVRESIGVQDDSPLKLVKMRNNYEHYDERLDRWSRDSKNHNHFDLAIMPSGTVGLDVNDMFRVFDPATTSLTYWGQEFNIQALINEVQRILPKLTEEANKPLWVK